MSDGDLLLMGVLTDPEDDTARLVYADWLDENGHGVRAEFIRLQILLHNTAFVRKGGSGAKWPEPWASLIRRERELVDAHGREWAGTAGLGFAPYMKFTDWFHRGFADHITFAVGTFLEDAPRVFSETPVTRVRLDGRNPMFSGTDPLRFRWERYTGTGRFGADEVPAFLFDRLNQPANGYRSVTGAWEALSRVLVDYGRDLVGLPPLGSRTALVSEACRE